MSRLTQSAIALLGRTGLALQRHPSWRRQAILTQSKVDLVFDVGAARGGFGTDIRQFGYHGRIVSFEPLKAAFAELEHAAAGDPAWSTVNAALGSEAGRQSINVASNSDSSSMLPMTHEHSDAAPQVGYVGTEEIRVERLDDIAPTYLTEHSRPYLKIDTQGFEREVLAGGAETLARCVGLQLELSFVPLYEGGMLVNEAISMAYEHGFVLGSITQGFTSPQGHMLQADGIFVRP